jgi:ABC-type Fe3+/spermidine/putrescine transport system ATPase subunit
MQARMRNSWRECAIPAPLQVAAMTTPAPVLDIAHVSHRYGAEVALDDVCLQVAPGEFLTLLGQSGSGKTTLLRVVAGLETPAQVDRLTISGQDVRQTPAALRDCCTVFQGYALFPHMSVIENVEFGLRVRGVPLAERRARATEALTMVRLSGKAVRRIHQLSGGERQRVGLARAIVTRPAILLLDEPLGALDERLRLDMQVELQALQKSLGITFIYVTHSQDEALTMSDRIALMRGGRIAQLGTPADLFDRPVSRFVADFMGCGTLIDGVVGPLSGDADGMVTLLVQGRGISGRWTGLEPPRSGAPATLALRAEHVTVGGSDQTRLSGAVIRTVYKGGYLDCLVQTDIGPISCRMTGDAPAVGSMLDISFDPARAAVVPQ